jgi:hypothetical protein
MKCRERSACRIVPSISKHARVEEVSSKMKALRLCRCCRWRELLLLHPVSGRKRDCADVGAVGDVTLRRSCCYSQLPPGSAALQMTATSSFGYFVLFRWWNLFLMRKRKFESLERPL